MKTASPFRAALAATALLVGVSALGCAAPRRDAHEPSTSRATTTGHEIEPTPGAVFESAPGDEKLVLTFEGGDPLCGGRKTREATGKYVVDFERQVVNASGTDACGGGFRRSSILTPAARAKLEELVNATKVPKQAAAFDANGEVAQARITMTIVHRGGQAARYGAGVPDPHEGHGARIRSYLDRVVH